MNTVHNVFTNCVRSVNKLIQILFDSIIIQHATSSNVRSFASCHFGGPGWLGSALLWPYFWLYFVRRASQVVFRVKRFTSFDNCICNTLGCRTGMNKLNKYKHNNIFNRALLFLNMYIEVWIDVSLWLMKGPHWRRH